MQNLIKKEKGIKIMLHWTLRKWGSYAVVYEDPNKYLIKLLWIGPGKKTSYQLHNHRKETWTILSGSIYLKYNDLTVKLFEEDIRVIPKKVKHQIINKSRTKPAMILEIWKGKILVENDIERLE